MQTGGKEEQGAIPHPLKRGRTLALKSMDFDAIYAYFDMPFSWLETVNRLNMQVSEK